MDRGMHEVGVMTSILEAVLEELKNHKVQKVEEVRLTIGDLTYLGEDQLSFAFEILTRGTILEGSTLVVEHEEVEVRCPTCGYDGRAEYYQDEMYSSNVPTLNCPRCGSRVDVVKGKSCTVRSIKVVEEDVPA
ncbi:MAG: hydrogenase maturation nickel metallochaperone HypA [Methanomassiliicoccus sp.]|nr:hydrogenase maturation nickel metallochaperone HypA [Methanomassiliicoccus sp.]